MENMRIQPMPVLRQQNKQCTFISREGLLIEVSILHISGIDLCVFKWLFRFYTSSKKGIKSHHSSALWTY